MLVNDQVFLMRSPGRSIFEKHGGVDARTVAVASARDEHRRNSADVGR